MVRDPSVSNIAKQVVCIALDLMTVPWTPFFYMRLFPAFFEDSFLGSVFHALVLKVPLMALFRGTSLRGGRLLGVMCLPGWCGAVQGLTGAYWSGKRRRRGSGRNGASGNASAGCGLAC